MKGKSHFFIISSFLYLTIVTGIFFLHLEFSQIPFFDLLKHLTWGLLFMGLLAFILDKKELMLLHFLACMYLCNSIAIQEEKQDFKLNVKVEKKEQDRAKLSLFDID